jgi:hypothetical protein
MKANNGKLTVTGPIVRRLVEIPLVVADSLPELDRRSSNRSPSHTRNNRSEKILEQPASISPR